MRRVITGVGGVPVPNMYIYYKTCLLRTGADWVQFNLAERRYTILRSINKNYLGSQGKKLKRLSYYLLCVLALI